MNAKKSKYDFSGFATKTDLLCSDGRIIRKGAFKDCDGKKVPLVWQHMKDSPENVLGHAMLEYREDGVYAYCSLNETDRANHARELIKHGDINSLSIYANRLRQNGQNVVHGNIIEVSLVYSGANPGALIENTAIEHSDGDLSVVEDEAVVYSGALLHEDQPEESAAPQEEPSQDSENQETSDKTIAEILDSMTDEQRGAVYYLVQSAAEESMQEQPEQPENSGDEEAAQSENMEDSLMHKNVFELSTVDALMHDDRKAMKEIVSNALETAKRNNSSFKEELKHGFEESEALQHADKAGVNYGIKDIELLFPDAAATDNQPIFISRNMEWVAKVVDGAKHSPFTRVKTLYADITAEEARARGYIKGNLKKDEVFRLLKRVTQPTTVYKKQRLDHDDIIDIKDLDAVMYLKKEMQVMLKEELARAVLIGDGRDAESPDKINEDCIRPIYKMEPLFAVRPQVAKDASVDDIVDAIITSFKEYRGTGRPTMFTTYELHVAMKRLKNKNGDRIYHSEEELVSDLGVAEIVDVDLMDGMEREGSTKKKHKLLAILVNMQDYTIGTDRGGEISNFEDFDIDYNQHKYLTETRLSGALTIPRSAIIVEQYVEAASNYASEEKDVYPPEK